MVTVKWCVGVIIEQYFYCSGCHRTAFELCKLLLRYFTMMKSGYNSILYFNNFNILCSCNCSLAPDTDPLCVLLMIDYHSLRAFEYRFLIDFQEQWEVCLCNTFSLTFIT